MFVQRNGRPGIAKVCLPCFQVFANKSNLTRHVKNIHGDRDEKDVRGEAVSIDVLRQGEMGAVEKISLVEMENKDSVLNNDSLSDEQKVILNNETFKKDLF